MSLAERLEDIPIQDLDLLPSMARTFALLPQDCHITLLLRHSIRKPIPQGAFGNDVNLTPGGVEAAVKIGALLGQRQVDRIMSSPLTRCMQTATALVRGSGWNCIPIADRRLGDPGVFVVNPELAGPFFSKIGTKAVVSQQLDGTTPVPGMRSPSEGVQLLLHLMLGKSYRENNNHLDVFVTHDAILAVLIGHLLTDVRIDTQWPSFLEGVFIWHTLNGLGFAWRGAIYTLRWLDDVTCTVGNVEREL